jgi:hypothetical protein
MSLRVSGPAHSSKEALAMHASVTLEWAETPLNEAVGWNVFLTQSEDSRHPLTCFLERMTLSVCVAVTIRNIKSSYSSSLHIMIQFITPNRIFVRSLPHLFSSFSMRLFWILVEATKVARFWAIRIQFTWSHLIIYAFKVHIIHLFTPSYWRKMLQYCPWSASVFFESQPIKLTLTECNKNICLFILTGYAYPHPCHESTHLLQSSTTCIVEVLLLNKLITLLLMGLKATILCLLPRWSSFRSTKPSSCNYFSSYKITAQGRNFHGIQIQQPKLNTFIHSFIHSLFCLTTSSRPPPKRFLHIVRSGALNTAGAKYFNRPFQQETCSMALIKKCTKNTIRNVPMFK